MAELHRSKWLLLQRRLRASPHRATYGGHPWPLDKPNAIPVPRTFPSTDPATNIPTNNCAADDVDAFDNPNLGADPRAIGAAVGGAIVAAVPAPVCAAVLERIAGSILCSARAAAGSKARPWPTAVPIGQHDTLLSDAPIEPSTLRSVPQSRPIPNRFVAQKNLPPAPADSNNNNHGPAT